MTYEPERTLMCTVGKLLYDRGYAAANDGNLSVLVEPGRLLLTPSGVSKGRMTPEMLLVTDLEGRVLEGDRYPSSETKMHLAVYRGRSDVRAVVHAHPTVSTAFAVCRRGLETPYLGGTGGRTGHRALHAGICHAVHGAGAPQRGAVSGGSQRGAAGQSRCAGLGRRPVGGL